MMKFLLAAVLSANAWSQTFENPTSGVPAVQAAKEIATRAKAWGSDKKAKDEKQTKKAREVSDEVPTLKKLGIDAASLSLDPDAPKLTSEQQQELIKTFSGTEQKFRDALANFSYLEKAVVEILDDNDQPAGFKYEVVWLIDLEPSQNGERFIRHPKTKCEPSFPGHNLDDGGLINTGEDTKNYQDLHPFALTGDDIGKYQLEYLGVESGIKERANFGQEFDALQRDCRQFQIPPTRREHVYLLDAYVFSVRPKEFKKGESYFEGLVWVDRKQRAIVKTEGKRVPILDNPKKPNLFPKFTTYRLAATAPSGTYLFPDATYAVDSLRFPGAPAIRVGLYISYENYRERTSSGEDQMIGIPSSSAPDKKP